MPEETDPELSQALEEAATEDYRDIAEIVGVTSDAVRDRIDRMKAEGTRVPGSSARVSQPDLGMLAVLLINTRPGRRIEVVTALLELEEVSRVATLAGDYDVIAHLSLRDSTHLRDVLHHKLEMIDDIIEMVPHVVTWSTSPPESTLVQSQTVQAGQGMGPKRPLRDGLSSPGTRVTGWPR